MNRIDVKSDEYPRLLKQIKDPPEYLYYLGEWNPDIFYEILGVVGSRRITGYGEIMTDELVKETSGAGITIVSGFMYGVDARAHTAALDAGGRTIAVMPCGIEMIHPEYQDLLHARILKCRGLVVSEYPGDMPPALWTYPRRNRIIAGLAPNLLIIEAGLKSGALITAKIAVKYNRHLFAVPGPLTSSVSRGTALLIKQGATIITNVEDLLQEYGRATGENTLFQQDASTLNKGQNAITGILSREPMSIDEIARTLNRGASDIGADLTLLSLRNIVVLRDRKYSLRKRRYHVD